MLTRIASLTNCRLWNFNSELRIPHSALGCSESELRTSELQRGFTLIEIIVVIVILSIVSAITIKFLTDSLRIYTMTVNQKTLLDEGKLALERMCRDIRDAEEHHRNHSYFHYLCKKRCNDPGCRRGNPHFSTDRGASTLQKVKTSPAATSAMANDVSTFAVTNATNEIQLA